MSEIDPHDILSAGPPMDESFDPPPPDHPPAVPAKKQEREGLPPGYRMRADSHYVEHLMSGRAGRDRADAVPVIESLDAPDGLLERGEWLLQQLSTDLATIESAVGALAGDTSRMARRAQVDVIKSHVWRAAWALQARSILDGRYTPRIRPRPLGFLLGQLRSGWASECRLSDMTFDVRASDWNAVVAVDETALIAGLTGAIIATLGLVGPADGTTLAIEAVAGAGRLLSVDVAQDDVLVAPSVGGRLFDASWGERPGGWLAALGATTAKAVARQHGGDAILLVDDDRGSTLRLTFASDS